MTCYQAALMAEGAENREKDLFTLQARIAQLELVLELIASPRRSDGTYNRSREACEELAREALKPNASEALAAIRGAMGVLRCCECEGLFGGPWIMREKALAAMEKVFGEV